MKAEDLFEKLALDQPSPDHAAVPSNWLSTMSSFSEFDSAERVEQLGYDRLSQGHR